MDVNIIERESMTIVGVVAVGNTVQDIDIAKLWQRFIGKYENIKSKIEDRNYEIHVWDKFDPQKHYCFIGVEVQEIKTIPIELFVKVIPKHTYAVFTHCFKDGGYDQAYKNIDEWLKGSQYTDAFNFDIQCYDGRFKGQEDPESIIEFHIPVKLK